MRSSLTVKWILTLLLSSLVGVALVGFFAYRTTSTEFDRFLNEGAEQDFIDNVTRYYESQEGWQGINNYLNTNRPDSNNPGGFKPQLFAVANKDGVILSEAGPYHLNNRVPPDVLDAATSITINQELIGYAVSAAPPPGLSPQERQYLQNTNRALVVGIIGASAVAGLIGLLLSQQFLYPLSELTQAITAMKSGDLNQQVPVHTRDELGQLAETFNQMSAEIHRANYLRQQMTADIAHDLRTPLQVITGYIEAMREGVLSATPERFEAMNQEANLLKRLIEDLRILSLADAKELKLIYQRVDPKELLQQIKDTFEPIAGEQDVTILIETNETLPLLKLDKERILQVLTNLVSNALRYTSSGGKIILLAHHIQGAVQLAVQDTGTGIPEDKLENIFERFYRVDESRHEVQGESGLGLAIVKSIVEAHQGKVKAFSKLGEGSTFTITLPTSP